ncbi:MAG: GIY-YIG nuclease family protein [Patescibacteria group bacterium]
MENNLLLSKVKKLPKVPGVYLFKNSAGKIIYVGKAKILRNRVKSYFQGNLLQGSKTKSLVDRIFDLEYIEALSELEALILEAQLIKKYKPKYNIALKDDKSYLYIVIRNEKVIKSGREVIVPKVLTCHETDLKRKDIVFGPYPHGRTAQYVVRTLRKALPYRDCSVSKFNKYARMDQPCLYGHIGLCSAPCTSSTSILEYKKDISRLRSILSGKSSSMLKRVEKQMQHSSLNQEYEKAAKYRDILKKFRYIRQSFRTADKYIENPYLVEDMINQALDSLVLNIPHLNKLPKRIECYDISNLSGKEATGSMVVAINGRLTNKEYRNFKIKLKDTPDDFAMMREVLYRRLSREVAPTKTRKPWGTPDLLVVDGGKGQVSIALEVAKELNVDLPIIGLAKRFEHIVYFDGENFSEIALSKSDPGLKLLQRLRDESHRFARRYHHKLRLQKIRSS